MIIPKEALGFLIISYAIVILICNIGDEGGFTVKEKVKLIVLLCMFSTLVVVGIYLMMPCRQGL